MASLETSLGKICSLKNPIVLASGINGSTAGELIRVAKDGAGALTIKSCNVGGRTGHQPPVCVPSEHFTINAVGLPNPGAQKMVEEINQAVIECSKLNAPIFAAVFGETVEEFVQAAQIIEQARPALIEVNISCPNTQNKTFFSDSPESVSIVTSAVKNAVKTPISVKLAPNVPSIGKLALAAQEAGADCITAVNTMPGMIIDAVARRPILTNKVGGVSGPALKPIALKCVYNIRQVCDIPIIGTGGVNNGVDAAEMLLAGANAVGVGTAFYYRKNAFKEIVEELNAFMDENGFSKISDLKLQD